MIPEIEEAREWRPLIKRLTQLAAVLLLIIGVLAVVLIRTNQALDQSRRATVNAQQAGMTAQRAIDCTNNVLAARATTTADDNKAHVDFQAAFTADAKAFGVLLTDILSNAPTSKSTPDFLAYIKAHTKLIEVSVVTTRILQADQDYRDAHPIGLC